jgi:DNA-binding CsgD family transcriptional regulator
LPAKDAFPLKVVARAFKDMLAILLALDGTTMGAPTFARFERSGPFGEREKAIATLLMPHLQRAAAINRLLDIAALERSTFAALFGLTPTEARVFDHLAAGHSVAQTAAALRVKDSTVKTHLLRVYDKTGVRRQAELVRLAASLTAPFGPTPAG